MNHDMLRRFGFVHAHQGAESPCLYGIIPTANVPELNLAIQTAVCRIISARQNKRQGTRFQWLTYLADRKCPAMVGCHLTFWTQDTCC